MCFYISLTLNIPYIRKRHPKDSTWSSRTRLEVPGLPQTCKAWPFQLGTTFMARPSIGSTSTRHRHRCARGFDLRGRKRRCCPGSSLRLFVLIKGAVKRDPLDFRILTAQLVQMLWLFRNCLAAREISEFPTCGLSKPKSVLLCG